MQKRIQFWKKTLPLLAEASQIPSKFRCPQKSVAEGMEGLCMLLKTFAYPCRYADMVSRFGRPVPVICMVTNWFLDFVYDKHGHRILQWNDDILNPRSIQEYVNAITRKGAAQDTCFGFIHGTVRPISQPGTNQRLLYNGHKRVPAIKFQSLLFQMVLFYKYVWPSLSSGQLVRLTEIWRPKNVRQ